MEVGRHWKRFLGRLGIGGETYLVVYFARHITEVDGLLEGTTFSVQLDALGPVIESASNVDFFSGLVPGERPMSVALS